MPTCHPESTVSRYLERGWWGPETLPQLLRQRVEATPDAPAITDPANLAELTGAEPRTLTWREFDDYTVDLAAVLLARGIGQGDTVAVQLPNSVAQVAFYCALWRIGAIATPMPTSYRRHELSGIVAATDAVAVVTTSRLGDRRPALEALEVATGRPGDRRPALEVATGRPGDRRLAEVAGRRRVVLAVGPGAPEGAVAVELRPEGDRKLVRDCETGLAATVNDRVTVCWTSGTEAAPKGVPRCHGDWLAMGRGVQDALAVGPDSVLLNPFPLVNMAGFAGALLPWLLGGGHLVQHHPFDLPVFLAQLARHRATHTTLAPALLTMLLDNEQLRSAADLSSLRRVGSGGAPLPPAVVRRWQEELGVEVVNFFGSNEGVCLLGSPVDIPEPMLRAQHLPRYGVPGVRWSTGLADSTEVKLVDPATGAPVTEPGGRGELRLRGPAVFGGYLPGTATSEPFDADGFLCSGDVFELCGPDGRYLRFVDRVKEIIIRGGMNIAPAEIEALLGDLPGVAELAIVGYPDPVLGERCCAVVVPAPGATVTLEDLRVRLRAEDVASFKLPERIEIVDALPRNAVGKVLRRELRRGLQ